MPTCKAIVKNTQWFGKGAHRCPFQAKSLDGYCSRHSPSRRIIALHRQKTNLEAKLASVRAELQKLLAS